jgi:hypothetical protein
MKTVGKTLGIYLIVVIIIGITLGLLHIAATDPLTGAAYTLGFSLRIWYITLPLLVILFFVLRRYADGKETK